MKRKILFVPLAFLMLAALACNAPIEREGDDEGGGAAAAITALAATNQAQKSAVAPATAAATLTATLSAPMVTVSQATNCRTGPGTQYDQVGSLGAGQSAQPVGKYTPGNYWIIDTPGGSGTCWLWGQYATTSGDTSGLPEMTPPATPTPQVTNTPKPTRTPTPTATAAAPAAPSNFAQNRSCAGGFKGVTPIWIEDITLTWQDNASNETGYYIIKGGAQLPALPANSTQYHITMRYNQGTGGALYTTFGVEAFNGAGVSGEPQLDVPTCP